MTGNVSKKWEYGQIDLTTTGTVYEVCRLHGGESLTIKALSTNSGSAYIGSDNLVSATTGFELDSSETLTLTLPITFGRDNEITIYAVTDNGTDDLCWIKLIGMFPSTEGSTGPAAGQ